SLCIILLLIPDMVRGWYLAVWALLAIIPAFGGHIWGMKEPLIALIPRIIHQLSIAFWLGALAYIIDRKSTRLNSSHVSISYAVFCLKKKMFDNCQVLQCGK